MLSQTNLQIYGRWLRHTLGPLPPASSTANWHQKQSVIPSFVFVPFSAPEFLSKILSINIRSVASQNKQVAICSNVLVLSEKPNGKSRMTKTQTLLKIPAEIRCMKAVPSLWWLHPAKWTWARQGSNTGSSKLSQTTVFHTYGPILPWTPVLGFQGCFATNSVNYSVTRLYNLPISNYKILK